jgi:peptidoglycan/LPS O-acetylase OafA/YrhL
MLSIVLCHLVQEVGNNKIAMLSQFFNVGVFIFLFISGYLHGNKKIDNKEKWFINKFIKLMIPMYIFMTFLFGIELLYIKNFQIKYVLIYLFDLQYFCGGVQGAQHLWFMSVIIICYLITPFLVKMKDNNQYKIINIITLIVAIFTTYINQKLGQTLFYILTYLLGYTFKNKQGKNKFKKCEIILIIILAIIVRMLGKYYIDGVLLYDTILVSITQIALCFGIYLILQTVSIKLDIKSNKIINHLDKISYPMYITHYIFMIGPLKLMNLMDYLEINIFLTLLASYISSLLLLYITKLITNKYLKLKRVY